MKETCVLPGKLGYITCDEQVKIFKACHTISVGIKLGPESGNFISRGSAFELLGNRFAEVFLDAKVERVEIIRNFLE